MKTKFFLSFAIAIFLALCASSFASAQHGFQPCYEEDEESTELYQPEMPLQAAVESTAPDEVAIQSASNPISIADVQTANDSRIETAKSINSNRKFKLNTTIAYSPPNLNYQSFESNPDRTKLIARQDAKAPERRLIQRE